MSSKTQATQALSKAGISFTLLRYDYQPEADKKGIFAANVLGESPDCVLKTLMVEIGGKPACAIIPSGKALSMKKVAQVFEGKDAKMMKPEIAERMTGYNVGGISPFGQKKKVPMAFEAASMTEPYVIINGGQRGILLKLAPLDAVAFLQAKVADLVLD